MLQPWNDVSQDHITGPMANCNPSSSCETVAEVPNIQWDDIGEFEDTKWCLQDIFFDLFHHLENFGKFGMQPFKGMLFHGRDVCGKTLLLMSVAASIAFLPEFQMLRLPAHDLLNLRPSGERYVRRQGLQKHSWF